MEKFNQNKRYKPKNETSSNVMYLKKPIADKQKSNC